MPKQTEVTIFWFRRDLRLNDNKGLFQALLENKNVLSIFIFDQNILKQLEKNDHRVTFIYDQVSKIKKQLQSKNSDLLVLHDEPQLAFKTLFSKYQIKNIYTNHDYEPYGQQRDREIHNLALSHGCPFYTFKDQVVFEKNEIVTDQNKPYTVFTPYKKKWLSQLTQLDLIHYDCSPYENHYLKWINPEFLRLSELGFTTSPIPYPELKLSKTLLQNYEKLRDFPFEEKATSKLGLHLRFGTTSIRYLVSIAKQNSEVWLSELIWRDFFNQILFHFPHSAEKSFRLEYENIEWRNQPKEFELWVSGQTGYPLVDAGMRELKNTGHMHNRVRMVTASFLTKHLLHHWKRGERYFAQYLFDYDLSANVGNWQWAAGTGCDAAPYFRIFNPTAQQEKFDPDLIYIKKWVPEYGTAHYVNPMITHNEARDRCLMTYKKGLGKI